jgi:photosystem II stability/assembly factor-like uncharacterized protein
VLISADGGASWAAVSSRSTANLNAVAIARSAAAAWAVGDGGLVLRSGDGGRSWAVAHTGGAALRAVKFADDALHGFAAGDSGALLATGDGGATWRALPAASADLRGLSVSDDGSRVVAVGARGLVWRSADGGTSWSQIVSGTSSTLNAVGFFDENPAIGWVVGMGGTVLFTDDGAAHTRALNGPLSGDIYSVEDL